MAALTVFLRNDEAENDRSVLRIVHPHCCALETGAICNLPEAPSTSWRWMMVRLPSRRTRYVQGKSLWPRPGIEP